MNNYCKNCGNLLKTDEKFCANCGISVSTEQNISSNNLQTDINIFTDPLVNPTGEVKVPVPKTAEISQENVVNMQNVSSNMYQNNNGIQSIPNNANQYQQPVQVNYNPQMPANNTQNLYPNKGYVVSSEEKIITALVLVCSFFVFALPFFNSILHQYLNINSGLINSIVNFADKISGISATALLVLLIYGRIKYKNNKLFKIILIIIAVIIIIRILIAIFLFLACFTALSALS